MAELCHRTGTPEVDRAWEVLNETLSDEFTIKTGTRQRALWQPSHWLLRWSCCAYLCIMIGALIIMVPYCFWLYLVQEKQFDGQADVAPENRLPPAIVGSVFIPIYIIHVHV
jgi:hypothetical protein